MWGFERQGLMDGLMCVYGRISMEASCRRCVFLLLRVAVGGEIFLFFFFFWDGEEWRFI